MILNAFLTAFVVWFADMSEAFLSNGMFKRPLVVGTVLGFLLGDVSTGAIVGGSLELVFMGTSSIGGVHTTEPHVATGIVVALCIIFGYSYEEAFTFALPAGMVGVVLQNFYKVLKAALCPIMDKLVSEDKMNAFCALHFFSPWVFSLLPAVAVFLGIYIGADTLEVILNAFPEFVTVGMNAAAKMLSAVGFTMLLNTVWDKKLIIYFVLGFSMAACLGVSNIFAVIIGVFLAYVEISKFMDKPNGGSVGVADKAEDEMEGFLDA